MEVCDVVSARPYPSLIPSPLSAHTLYVSREAYEEDLKAGLETARLTHNQLVVDLPRCTLLENGTRTSWLDTAAYPTSLLRFCTQAIFAFPVEVISSDNAIVAECPVPERMRVEVWGRTVVATKVLRVVTRDCSFDATIRVHVDMEDPCAVVRYTFASKDSSGMLSMW